MERSNRIVALLFQLLSLVFLMVYMSYGGINLFLGEVMTEMAKVVVQFGIAIITLAGIATGLLINHQKHRIFRDTYYHGLKYIWVLILYQTLMWFLGGAAGSIGGELMQKMPPLLVNIIVLTFSMIAFMMPFNYVKSMFTKLKSVEHRNPKRLIRQLLG
jgi:hypothetical protein